jgi:glucose-6-phosphate 1-dehydrogenase
MTSHDRPTVLVIIGVTGDLSRRYLLPALEDIARAEALPSNFRLLGTSRQPLSTSDVLGTVAVPTDRIASVMDTVRLDPTDSSSYTALSKYLDDMDSSLPEAADRLFYLSIPPQVAWPVIEQLGLSGLSGKPRTKLLLEKPFGTDLDSAETLLTHVERYFDETQVFRIDHYLAKEMAQNLLVFRQSNPIFNHTWNATFIERIDITIAEALDIEGRSQFYEQTGALRDIVQSHALQLAAIMLMPLTEPISLGDVPSSRRAALAHLHVPPDKPLTASVRRGQYEGYRDEVQNPASTVETYTDITLVSSDPNWDGVPVRIRTGKALPDKQTELRVTYRGGTEEPANVLTFRLQPNAGIELGLWSKRPGYERQLERQRLTFDYGTGGRLPDAYEQVLLDAFAGDHTLFTSGDEVRESWRILKPIQDAWALKQDDLFLYAKRSLPADDQQQDR